MNSSPPKKAGEFLAPFLLMLVAYCTWILTLPIFPSLDGSLHLYYASVLGSLLSGSRAFSSYYFIRHVLPPYALHYYFLIVAAHFFGYVIADKFLVCLILIVTAFGFRYLARQLGPSGNALSLLVIPLILNWPLGMGFYNYCLAIGMALWALGLWYRAVQVRSHRTWIAFLVLLVLIVLTHPVPALFLYILVGIDIAWRISREFRLHASRDRGAAHLWHMFRWDIVYMLAAWSTFSYISLFIGGHRVLGNLTQTYPRKLELTRLAKLSTLAMFSGAQPAVLAYRISLYCILIAAVLFASTGLILRWRTRTVRTSDVLLFCSLSLLIVIPILPPVMNGANYFAQRLMILVWIGVLATASGHARLPARLELWIVFCAFVYGICVLGFANFRIRPVASRISQIETVPIAQSYLTGLTLGLPDAPDPTTLNYVPYYWAGARYFRRSKSTLLNGGWLYEYYLPLGSNLHQMTTDFSPSVQDSPGTAYRLLMSSPEARRQVMPHANLVLFTGQATLRTLTDALHVLDGAEPSRQWRCSAYNWYSVCTARVVVETPSPPR